MRIDKQATTPPPGNAIPIISPVLHFLAMPALVFWRRDFGYLFLRPKSVFLSCCIASAILSYIVFHEPGLKPAWGTVAAFSLAVSALYLIHLLACMRTQVASSADHDLKSGSSRLLAFWPESQRHSQEKFIHMVAEPALTLILGLGLVWSGWGILLGYCLMVAGAAILLKEATNAWLTLRSKKVMKDRMSTVESDMPDVDDSPLLLPGVEGKAKRQRRSRISPKSGGDT